MEDKRRLSDAGDVILAAEGLLTSSDRTRQIVSYLGSSAQLLRALDCRPIEDSPAPQ